MLKEPSQFPSTDHSLELMWLVENMDTYRLSSIHSKEKSTGKTHFSPCWNHSSVLYELYRTYVCVYQKTDLVTPCVWLELVCRTVFGHTSTDSDWYVKHLYIVVGEEDHVRMSEWDLDQTNEVKWTYMLDHQQLNYRLVSAQQAGTVISHCNVRPIN